MKRSALLVSAALGVVPTVGLSVAASLNSAQIERLTGLKGTMNEKENVLKALRAYDIKVVAIHNHMVNETPRMVFLHYWGTGPAAVLAKGVRSALDTQSKHSHW
jgi:hypothetical protein